MDFKHFKIPVFMLDAVTHSQITSFSKVFSFTEVLPSLYIRIPVEIARHFELSQVSEIRDTENIISTEDLWEHDPFRIWFRFNTDKLNMDTGHHVYKLLFVNRIDNESCILYFSYVIQNNNPDKPYNYMEKLGKECNCNE